MFKFINERLLNFAKSSLGVKGLMLLGSVAIGKQTDTSDLDVLFVITKEEEEKHFQLELVKVFNLISEENDESNHEQICQGRKWKIHIKAHIFMSGKTVIYLSDETGSIYKIDAGHTKDIMDKAKFIVGSEIKLCHLNDVILLDYTVDEGMEGDNEAKDISSERESVSECKVGQIFHQLECLLKSSNPYITSGLVDVDPKFHITEFVERFDSCLSSILKNDEYRVQFFLFILRHRILCLQMLLKLSIQEHVYLPKQAYRSDAVERFCISDSPILQLDKLLKAFKNLDTSCIDADDMFNDQMFEDYVKLLEEKLRLHKASVNGELNT